MHLIGGEIRKQTFDPLLAQYVLAYLKLQETELLNHIMQNILAAYDKVMNESFIIREREKNKQV